MKIKYEDYPNFKQFIIVFKKAIKKLVNLDISPPELWHLILFIMALFDAWPIQVEQQQLNSRKELTRLLLSTLIKDITDEAQSKDKKAKGEGGVLYRGKPDKKGKQKAKEDREKSKGKLYKNYKDLNAYYKPKNCFITNKKL